jgi:hypothetical protein
MHARTVWPRRCMYTYAPRGFIVAACTRTYVVAYVRVPRSVAGKHAQCGLHAVQYALRQAVHCRYQKSAPYKMRQWPWSHALHRTYRTAQHCFTAWPCIVVQFRVRTATRRTGTAREPHVRIYRIFSRNVRVLHAMCTVAVHCVRTASVTAPHRNVSISIR